MARRTFFVMRVMKNVLPNVHAMTMSMVENRPIATAWRGLVAAVDDADEGDDVQDREGHEEDEAADLLFLAASP